MSNFIKYEASVSDTDLLINIAKIGRLDILESLFSKIVIPKFIIDYEMLKNGKQLRFQILQHKRSNPSSPFEVIDKDQNKTFKRIVSYEYAEMIKYIDPGEA